MAEKIEQVDLIEQHNRDMTEYAIYIARKRVIPDYRDGLKSIHRRIIYAMYNDLHNTPDKNRSKTAKIVGQVMGSYHPHGNTAIADENHSMNSLTSPFEQSKNARISQILSDSSSLANKFEIKLSELSEKASSFRW